MLTKDRKKRGLWVTPVGKMPRMLSRFSTSLRLDNLRTKILLSRLVITVDRRVERILGTDPAVRRREFVLGRRGQIFRIKHL